MVVSNSSYSPTQRIYSLIILTLHTTTHKSDISCDFRSIRFSFCLRVLAQVLRSAKILINIVNLVSLLCIRLLHLLSGTISTISSISQSSAAQIFMRISVVTCPFRPILVTEAGLMPAFSHRSFFFMSLSMSNFQSFL